MLHDAAFDIAYTYIRPQKFAPGTDNNDDYGDYIELTRVFDFVDMEYLENLFSKNGLVDFLKKTSKQYDDIHDIIVAFRQLMPYTRMLISSDGYLIPMDDKYFRIDPKNLGFKYGGEITCVGMITNIIGADTDPDDPKNLFATLQFKVNEILRTILPTNAKNLCVIHPIAVFYGG